jgi:HEAT repeat protein
MQNVLSQLVRRCAVGACIVVILSSLTVGCGTKKQKAATSAELITTLKEHKDADMRAWAARELGHMPGQEAAAGVQALTDALQDPQDNVRMAAAYGLADLGAAAAAAVPALSKTLEDRSAQVRTAATYALKQIQPKK